MPIRAKDNRFRAGCHRYCAADDCQVGSDRRIYPGDLVCHNQRGELVHDMCERAARKPRPAPCTECGLIHAGEC